MDKITYLLAGAVAALLIVVISETEAIIRYRKKLKQLRKENDEDAAKGAKRTKLC